MPFKKRTHSWTRFISLTGRSPKVGTPEYAEYKKKYEEYKSDQIGYMEKQLINNNAEIARLKAVAKKKDKAVVRLEKKLTSCEHQIQREKKKNKRKVQKEEESKGIKKYEVAYDDTGLFTNSRNQKVWTYRRYAYIKTENSSEAEKFANDIVSFRGEDVEFNEYWRSDDRKLVHLKVSKGPEIVDIGYLPMKGVVNWGYSLFNCDPNFSEDNQCVIRYLEERLKKFTDKKHSKIPKHLSNSSYLHGYFYALQQKFSKKDFPTEGGVSFNLGENLTDIIEFVKDPDTGQTVRKFNYNFVDADDIDETKRVEGGVTPDEINKFCQQFNFSNLCITTNGYVARRHDSTDVHRNRPSFVYISNGYHLYPIRCNNSIRQCVERYKKDRKCKVEKDQDFEITDYHVVDTLKDALQIDDNKVTFILDVEGDKLTEYMTDRMKKEQIVFDKARYKNDSEGKICSFDNLRIHGDVLEVVEICKILKLKFIGQSLTSVVMEYFNNQFGSMETSQLNRELFNELINTSRGGVSMTLAKYENLNNTIGFDICKCYSSVLWEEKTLPVFDCFCDSVEVNTTPTVFKDKFLYKVKTSVKNLLLRGDGLYYGFILNECVKRKDVAFCVTKVWKPSGSISKLSEIVETIYKQIGEKLGKVVINSFIGLLGKNLNKKSSVFYDKSIFMVSEKCVHIKDSSIFKESEDPELFKVVNTQAEDKVITNMPANVYITQKGRLKTLQLIEALGGKLLRVIIDCAIVEGGSDKNLIHDKGFYALNKKQLENPFHIGCYKKIPFPEVTDKLKKAKVDTQFNSFMPERRMGRDLRKNIPRWRVVDIPDEKDTLGIAQSIINHGGGYITGLAGTGKSYVLKQVISSLTTLNEKCHIMAFTNTAAILIGGKTLHKSFCLNVCESAEKAKTSGFSKGDWIVIDEISLIPIDLWAVLLRLKERGCRFILCGDLNQLPPVHDVSEKIKINSLCIINLAEHLFELKINKRSDETVFNLCKSILNHEEVLDKFIWTQEMPSENEYHITLKNETRNRICRYLQTKLSKSKGECIRIPGNKVKGDVKKWSNIQSMILWRGAPVECYKASKSLGIVNGSEFIIVDWDNDNIYIGPENDPFGNNLAINRSDFKYHIRSNLASTCHRAQGKTITNPIRIWDSSHTYASERWLYTAISRTVKYENIRFSEDFSWR